MILSDPNAGVPQPISGAGGDQMMGQILSATGEVSIRLELIHAMKKAGRIVTESLGQVGVVLLLRPIALAPFPNVVSVQSEAKQICWNEPELRCIQRNDAD
jgi:hypothetical protein